jgi:hypothetical protein
MHTRHVHRLGKLSTLGTQAVREPGLKARTLIAQGIIPPFARDGFWANSIATRKYFKAESRLPRVASSWAD